ncbi:uncharacterized protein A1O9_08103 [Exophiala aquamarina CBS 119918]|uniref:Uncharacterized protein n=1 Tax=Exophiala aquamarina CBS 119918 TaxID=1182545 RepID=A0A072P7V1_9EURO|nr:uncharacterized protein A1O9_08103 [Exophiala aquamarina CBS 119918]KEF55353.1 hypothetical protein A1O9_08103 [Exophiala aquamarina CBS 119918]
MVLLWYYDKKNDGFKVKEGTSHYAWAYAPTIVVVLVLATWRLVDHSAKISMPFDALQDGPVKGSQSLLLDYASKFQLVSLLEAIKNSHFAVIASISGFVLLKVITVFSTGLLVLLPTAVKQTDTFIQARAFSADSFDPTIPLNTSTFSSIPVYTYYGNVVQGMPFDNGVTADLAYSIITVESDSPIPEDATIEGEVAAFVPLLTCKKLDVTVDTPTTVDDSNAADALATSPDISLTIKAGDVCGAASSLQVPADNPYTEITPNRRVLGTLQQIFCGSSSGTGADAGGPAGILLTVTDITYQQTLFDNATELAGGTFTIASDVSRTLNKITNIFCSASYSITQVKLTNNTRLIDSSQAVSIQPVENAKNSTLPRLSDWNVTNIYAQSSVSAEALFGDVINDDTISDSSAMFSLMALTQGTDNIDTLLDADKLMAAAVQTYNGILSQYAHQLLRDTNSNELEDGTVTMNQPRLRVNDVSVWTIGAVCGVLALLSIALVFIAPRGVVPRDPSSIATIAMLLTRSVELNRLLRRQPVPSLQNQKDALSGYEFGTAIATSDAGRISYRIVTSEGEPDPPVQPTTHLRWWLPISATIPFLAVTVLIPLVLIAVLEVLQRSSDKNDGLFTVADDKWTEIYSHYIPGVVMLIVAALINMLDFNIALFAPWVNLAKGNAVSRRSVLNHLLGRSPPLAFMQALKTRNLSAILSILAATMAAILTVVASGLYTVEYFTLDGPEITLRTVDSFSLKWTDSFASDKGAAAMLDLVLHNNGKYPQFTYEGLAFPSLSLNNSQVSTDSLATASGSYSQILDAYQGNLRCEILNPDSYNITTEQAGPESAYPNDMAFMVVTAALPDSCHLGGSSGEDSVVTYENDFVLLPNGQVTFAGAQLDLLFGENSSLYGNFGEERGQYISDNPPVGCPSLAFTFGQFKLDDDNKDQVTTMVCYQEIQTLKVNVTLKSNSTRIDTELPPVIQDGTVAILENPNSNNSVKSFDFRIENNLAQEMTLFNGDNSTAAAADPSSTATLDIYFQAIINGPDRMDPASLVGVDNQDRLQEAVNRFYQMYMAQAISANMRQPANGSTATSSRLVRRQDFNTLTTGTTTIAHPRLVQHKESKLLLQILLGLMTALAAAAWSTTKFRHVLPCNPASIAGTMALLAGSDLCYATDEGLCECCGKSRRRSFGLDGDRLTRPESIHAGPEDNLSNSDDDEESVRTQQIPEGAEWMRADQFKTLFGGKRYSLGWWRERRGMGKRRRFGIDIGERADGDDDQDWELGHRRPQGAGFENFMMRNLGGRGEYSSLAPDGAHARRPSGAGGPRPDSLGGQPWNRDADVGYEPPRHVVIPGSGGPPGRGGEPGPGTVGRRANSIMGGEA